MKELEKEGVKFLAAARAYQEKAKRAGIGGAVTWIKDTDGFGAFFTRGEYTDQLIQNIHRLGPTKYFGSMTENG